MLKEFIENKFRKIVLKIPNDLKEFPFYKVVNEILSEEFLKNFLDAELNWWIYEDRIFRNFNHSFNFKKLENSKVNDQIDEIYRENAIITQQELQDLIKKAIIFHTNFLLLPSKTLMTFVFSNSTHLTKQEILLKLNFFSAYNLLIEIIKSKISKDAVTRVEFEKIIRESLDLSFKNIDKEKFINIINEVNHYFGLNDNNIHLKIIEILFPQLGLEILLDRIKEELGDGKETIEINKFLKIISLNIKDSATELGTSNNEYGNLQDELNNDQDIDYIDKINKSLDKLINFYDELTINSSLEEENYASNSLYGVSNEEQTIEQIPGKNIDDIMKKSGKDELSVDDIDALFNQ